MPSTQHLSYAGVTLPLANPWIEERWLRVIHDQPSFRWFEPWNFDQPNTQRLPTPDYPRPPSFKLGVLTWPTGASNPAWFHTVVETNRLAAIRTAIGGTGNTAKPLVMFDNRAGKTVTASMFMLPPRPLNQLGDGASDAWLVTLTDIRFYWYFRRGAITAPSSWSNLYSQIGSILGVTITPDTINSAYGTPSSKWALPFGPTPVILDAAAAQIGQRVVVGLDGTVVTRNWETAKAASDAYLASSSRVMSGGLLNEVDIGRYVPAGVKVLFFNASLLSTWGTPLVSTQTLASLAISEYGSTTGVAGYYQTVNADTAFTGSNGAAIAAYASAAATDWYGWRLADVDTVYPGIEPWVPTGWEDTIEWTLKLVSENPSLPPEVGTDSTQGVPFASTLVRRGQFGDFQSGDYSAGYATQETPSNPSGLPRPWIPGLASDECIEMSVYQVGGSCTGIPTGQVIYLAYDSGDDWVSSEDFLFTPGGTSGAGTAGSVTYTRTAPVPSLAIGGVSGFFLAAVGDYRLYEFGGATLCSGSAGDCNNAFVVAVRCSAECATEEDDSFESPDQFIIPGGTTVAIPVLAQFILPGTAPSSMQFILQTSGGEGLDQFILKLQTPDGTQYVLVANPPDLTGSGQYIIRLDPTAPSALQDYDQFVVPVIGTFAPNDQFTLYPGPVNGLYQFIITNGGTQPAECDQFIVCFGTAASPGSITDVGLSPTSGNTPLAVTASPTADFTPQWWEIDWGDGDVSKVVPSALPVQHTFDTADTYEVVVRAVGTCGASAEDSETVTVTVPCTGAQYTADGHVMTQDDADTWTGDGWTLQKTGANTWTLFDGSTCLWQSNPTWDGLGCHTFVISLGSCDPVEVCCTG